MTRTIAQAIVILSMFAASAWSAIEPAPTTYVEDRAQILDADTRHRLIGLLQELEQKTTARVIVLTVDTTGGIPIEQYTFERADTWRFGANQKSASVVVVVAVKDRDYRIEVGYDWEGVLPDSLVGSIGRQYFVPNFKAERYSQGIFEGTSAIAGVIAREKRVTLSGMPNLALPTRNSAAGGRPRGGTCPCCSMFLILIVLWFLFRAGRRRRGLGYWGLLAWPFLFGGRGRHDGGHFDGSGFGGGGFGNFGGGGGGGFGGGGASGKW